MFKNFSWKQFQIRLLANFSSYSPFSLTFRGSSRYWNSRFFCSSFFYIIVWLYNKLYAINIYIGGLVNIWNRHPLFQIFAVPVTSSMKMIVTYFNENNDNENYIRRYVNRPQEIETQTLEHSLWNARH